MVIIQSDLSMKMAPALRRFWGHFSPNQRLQARSLFRHLKAHICASRVSLPFFHYSLATSMSKNEYLYILLYFKHDGGIYNKWENWQHYRLKASSDNLITNEIKLYMISTRCEQLRWVVRNGSLWSNVVFEKEVISHLNIWIEIETSAKVKQGTPVKLMSCEWHLYQCLIQ